MKTITLSRKDMEGRIARFRSLRPLPIQNESIPVEACDVIYSRKLLSVIGLGSNADTPINAEAPIRGAADMTMTLAVCPPGQGPGIALAPPDLRDLHGGAGPLRGELER